MVTRNIGLKLKIFKQIRIIPTGVKITRLESKIFFTTDQETPENFIIDIQRYPYTPIPEIANSVNAM